jgi:hypothetical protein
MWQVVFYNLLTYLKRLKLWESLKDESDFTGSQHTTILESCDEPANL